MSTFSAGDAGREVTTLRRTDPGHYVATDAVLPLAGMGMPGYQSYGLWPMYGGW